MNDAYEIAEKILSPGLREGTPDELKFYRITPEELIDLASAIININRFLKGDGE